LFFGEVDMTWRAIVLALIRCELKAKYSHISGWQVSAKGALPVVLTLAMALFLWCRS
jgi:hypothetical protein